MIFSVSTILLCTLDAAYQNTSLHNILLYTHMTLYETTKGRSFLVFVYSENNHYS